MDLLGATFLLVAAKLKAIKDYLMAGMLEISGEEKREMV